MYSANASQLPNASGTPQRGKLLVKIWVRALCSPESRPSRNGEFAEIASSSGSTGRSRSHTSTARSAPRTPDVDVQRERVVAPRDVLQPLLDAPVVLGLDDLLLAVVRPRMRAGRAERDAVLVGEREQPAAAVALCGDRGGEVLAPARADLDLRGDQLAGDRLGEHGISGRGVAQLLEALHVSPRSRGVEQRELLLEPDREVGRGLECRASGVQIEVHISGSLRSGRSTARRADRPPGSTCGR